MKFLPASPTTAVAVIVAFLLPTTSTLCTDYHPVFNCDTSDASPLNSHFEALATQLENESLRDFCYQTNFVGSRCTEQFNSTTAVIALCGPPGSPRYKARVSCGHLANLTRQFIVECGDTGRSGGSVGNMSCASDGLEAVFYHDPKCDSSGDKVKCDWDLDSSLEKIDLDA